MITNVAFVVPGEPQGKGRARIGKIGAHARMFTPPKTLAYEGLIAHAAQIAMRGSAPFGGDCRIEVDIVCGVPARWSRRKREMALAGSIRPAKKPDSDNVLKAVCDGLNGVVWRDDVQAVEGCWRKFYGEAPSLRVRVANVEGVE